MNANASRNSVLIKSSFLPLSYCGTSPAFWFAVGSLFLSAAVKSLSLPAYTMTQLIGAANSMTPMLLTIFSVLTCLGLAREYISSKMSSYELTETTLTSAEGKLNQIHRSIEVKDIKNITYTQNIFQKLYNAGTIYVSTAALGEEIVLYNVRNVITIYKDLKACVTQLQTR